MIARCAVIVAAFVVLGSGLSAVDGKENDKDKLQGEWALVSAEFPSGKWDANQIKAEKPLMIKGNEWTSSGFKFIFKIDPTKSPKQLDLQGEKNGKVNTLQGIYKIDGDTLTFCRSLKPGGARPTEFKAGDEVALLQFKRLGK